MVFLPDNRALLLDKDGRIYITLPEAQGFPRKIYMELENVHSVDEVGVVSVLLSQEWEAGDRSFYLYWYAPRPFPPSLRYNLRHNCVFFTHAIALPPPVAPPVTTNYLTLASMSSIRSSISYLSSILHDTPHGLLCPCRTLHIHPSPLPHLFNFFLLFPGGTNLPAWKVCV
jgi:hypothetical protein